GQAIYDETLKPILEPESIGRFVAIDVNSRRYFLGDTSSSALELARKEKPDGVFFLIKVGSSTAFRLTTFYGNGNLGRSHRI
ncbi:MAG TPA: hypothetical protein VGM92_09960, partial [Candidatus Kapabacteria bacterium]